MKQQRTLFIVIAASFLVLIVLSLSAALPVAIMSAFKEEETTAPPVTEEGEGVKYNTVLLYGPFDRGKPSGELSKSDKIKSITFQNGRETYSFVHPTEENYTDFVILQNGVVYDDLAINAELIAQVVVSVGTPYVRVRVGESENAVARYGEYGLSDTDNPNSCVLELYNGERYKVYIGEMTADKNGYYVRVEGRDTVYVTQTTSLGDLVLMGAGEFVNPSLTPEPKQSYASYFVSDFSVTKELRVSEKGADVALNGSVCIRYTRVRVIEKDGTVEATDTTSGTMRTSLTSKAELNQKLKAALEGKRIGDKGILVEPIVTTASADDGIRTVTSTYTVDEVLYTYRNETEIAFDFINDAEDRDYFLGAPMYELTAPQSMLQYPSNSNVIMNFLSNMQTVVGNRTIKLGITDEDMERYGLYAHTVRYLLPMKFSMEEENVTSANITSNTVTVNEEDYVPITLYVSERQKDGTYYVGSKYYDIIAIVDEETLPFLSYESREWIDSRLLCTYVSLLDEVKLSFGYSDFDKTYVFDVLEKRDLKNDKGYVTGSVLPMNGKEVDYTLLTEIHNLLFWAEYGDETGFTAEETEDVIAENPAVLTITFTLIEGSGGDGRTYEYKFIPYTDVRALLVITENGNAETASSAFYVDSVIAKTIALGLRSFDESGIVPDLSERYH